MKRFVIPSEIAESKIFKAEMKKVDKEIKEAYAKERAAQKAFGKNRYRQIEVDHDMIIEMLRENMKGKPYKNITVLIKVELPSGTRYWRSRSYVPNLKLSKPRSLK